MLWESAQTGDIEPRRRAGRASLGWVIHADSALTEERRAGKTGTQAPAGYSVRPAAALRRAREDLLAEQKGWL